jgi:hypothetical protein
MPRRKKVVSPVLCPNTKRQRQIAARERRHAEYSKKREESFAKKTTGSQSSRVKSTLDISTSDISDLHDLNIAFVNLFREPVPVHVNLTATVPLSSSCYPTSNSNNMAQFDPADAVFAGLADDVRNHLNAVLAARLTAANPGVRVNSFNTTSTFRFMMVGK